MYLDNIAVKRFIKSLIYDTYFEIVSLFRVSVPLSQDNTLFRYLQLKLLMHYVLKTCIKIS